MKQVENNYIEVKENDYKFLLNLYKKYSKLESVLRVLEKEYYPYFRNDKALDFVIKSVLKTECDAHTYLLDRKQYNNLLYVKKELSVNFVNEKELLYIKIKVFNKNTYKEFIKLASKYFNSNKPMIIDLLDNQGGDIYESLLIAGCLTNKQKICNIIDKYGTTMPWEKNATSILFSKLYLIINSETASASELMVAALMDDDRVYTVGGKTKGKALIQKTVHIKNFGGGALRYTFKEFFTLQGDKIDGIGINPDIKFINCANNDKMEPQVIQFINERC